jgi:hypothetical protein
VLHSGVSPNRNRTFPRCATNSFCMYSGCPEVHGKAFLTRVGNAVRESIACKKKGGRKSWRIIKKMGVL